MMWAADFPIFSERGEALGGMWDGGSDIVLESRAIEWTHGPEADEGLLK